jgi:WD repeat and SOF domain-containing protein 1
MKIKALSRPTSSVQGAGSSVTRQSRNYDPALHPFAKAQEYTRALTATKMERIFAKPFVDTLGRGHVDGVYRICNDPTSLENFASASGDGVVKVWDLPSRDEVWQAQAHENIVKGLCWSHDKKLLSCAADKTVKMWDPYSGEKKAPPLATWSSKEPYTSISHHRSHPSFAVCATNSIHIHDTNRSNSSPTNTLTWPTAVNSLTAVSFNQTETSILASCGTDHSIVLYDLRTATPLTKATLTFTCNAIAWNPMEAFNFAAASEDHNIYIFDMRNMKRSLNVLRDHVAAVMDVHFSPTGTELVSASYDRTVRLWNRERGHSRDIYHTKRMQRVFSCSYTADNNFVLSGSDDGDVRLWRSHASARSGIKSYAQRTKEEYDAALRKRYEHLPEIKRIARHRHVPKVVKKANEIKGDELSAIKRRVENERKHTKKGMHRRRAEREKMVAAVEE